MKKILTVIVFCSFFVLGSCATTYTGGLSLIDKPIRIGMFSSLVTENHPLVIRYQQTRDFSAFYQHMIEVLTDELPYYSGLVEEKTGFPLDISRFTEEFQKTGGTNVKLTHVPSGGYYFVEWWAETNISNLSNDANNNEAYAMVSLSHHWIEIKKNGKSTKEWVIIKIKT